MLLGSALFALLAGILSTLSPCVLPLLPIILVTAVSEHRLGPLALASGLALSFVAVGMFIATIGYGIGLDAGFFRIIAATMLVGARRHSARAATADADCRRRFADQRLDRGALRRHRDRRPFGAVRARPAARRRVEPLRRTNARRRLRAGGAGARIWPGGARHARFRPRRRAAAAAARASSPAIR